tara:strand:- start:27 stop:533 length:507 start_codon:yes stop_codon:yes gene_type:complete
MKKLLLILLCLPLIGFGQITQKTNVNINNQKGYGELFTDQKKDEGMTYLGDGEYSLLKIGGSGFVSTKKLTKKATITIADFAERTNSSFEIITVIESNMTIGVLPKVDVRFRLLDKNGNLILNSEESANKKNQAKKELINLKELLDMDIITKEEYDKKANQLKKIFLE